MQVATPLLDHQSAEPLDNVVVDLSELLGGVAGATPRRKAHQQLIRDARHDTNPALLDQLPVGDIVLDHPEQIPRRLFEHTRLEIHYDHRTRIATYRCLLTGETIGQLRALTTRYLLPTCEIGTDASPTPTR